MLQEAELRFGWKVDVVRLLQLLVIKHGLALAPKLLHTLLYRGIAERLRHVEVASLRWKCHEFALPSGFYICYLWTDSKDINGGIGGQVVVVVMVDEEDGWS